MDVGKKRCFFPNTYLLEELYVTFPQFPFEVKDFDFKKLYFPHIPAKAKCLTAQDVFTAHEIMDECSLIAIKYCHLLSYELQW